MRHLYVGRNVQRGGIAAVVDATYSDIAGGVRLDREIEGFKSWNLSDLRTVRGGRFRWQQATGRDGGR